MKITRKIISACTAVALIGASALFAEDTFDFSDSPASSGETGSTSTDTTTGDFGSFGSGSGGTTSPAAAASPVTLGGNIKLDARAYLDEDDTDTEDSPTKVTPDATLNVNYSNSATEMELKLNASKDSIETYNEDVIREATARAYLGNWILEGGKMKVVWGKGDKLHVIDNFNATDYTDFIVPDYIDRRLAEPMLRAIYNAPSGAWRMEAVYTPTMTADRFESSGVWEPAQMTTLTKSVKSVFSTALQKGYSAATIAAASGFDSDDLYPDTDTLKYGQAGIRLTGTAGAFDWGTSYYYGHYKQVSVNQTKLSAYLTDYIANGGSSNLDTGIDYDRLQVFGLEGATAVGPLNTRLEVAYNLTGDTDGDDPYVHNNSISWVPGFDIDLPVHNVNLNVQEIGTYILKGSKIKDNGSSDVDADADNCFSNNKIAVDLSDTFMHENLKLDCQFLYGIERGDLVIQPKVTYTVKTGMDLIASGMYIHCKDEDSEFYAYKDNSFAQIGIKYMF